MNSGICGGIQRVSTFLGVVTLAGLLVGQSAVYGYKGKLIEAVENNDLAKVKKLLDKGEDVNRPFRQAKGILGWTALIEASGKGRLEVVKLLLDRGADIDAKNKDGNTVFMEALLEGHPEIAKLLLDKVTDVNEKTNDGVTALMLASLRGYLEVVKLLLDKGAEVNAKDNNQEPTAVGFRNKWSNIS
jgi:ankyrin repeat protein